MPDTCHICGTDLADTRKYRPHATTFKCKYCYAPKSDTLLYCQLHGWWEIGPLPAPAGLTTTFDVGEEPNPNPIQPCAQPEPGQQPDRKSLLKNLARIKKRCKLLTKQSKGSGNKDWRNKIGEACELYDKLYFQHAQRVHLPDPDGFKDWEEHRTMMHTLIFVHLSAERHCADLENRYLHRHNAPHFAAEHLETCFFGADKRGPLIPERRRWLAKAVLHCDIVESYLKKNIGVARARQLALQECQDALPKTQVEREGIAEALDLRQWLKTSIMLFHCCTAKSETDESRSAFDPVKAHGYLSDQQKNALYDSDAPLPVFKASAKAMLGTLCATFRDEWPRPEGHPFPDADVDNDLEDSQKEFLQSVPTFDHTPSLGNDSPIAEGPILDCEANIRARVKARLISLFSDQSLTKLENALADREDENQSLADLRTRYRRVFEEFVVAPAGAGAGQPRTRRDMARVLDWLIADVRGNNYWVETTSNDGLFEVYVQNKKAGEDTHLIPFQLFKSCDRELKKVVTCSKSRDRRRVISWLPIDALKFEDNRRSCGDWYLDWRVWKDRLMYDYCLREMEHLPNFINLSPWRKTELPRPNPTYGWHAIVWDPSVINLNRAVLTLTDRGWPRRSVLLLLQDLFCPTKRRDDTAATSKEIRRAILDRMLLHLEHYVPNENVQPQSVPPNTENPLALDRWDRFRSASNIELHCFGQLAIDEMAQYLLMRTVGMEPDKVNPRKMDSSLLVEQVAGSSDKVRRFRHRTDPPPNNQFLDHDNRQLFVCDFRTEGTRSACDWGDLDREPGWDNGNPT